MYGYVYITENLLNNKKYIGQHKSEIFEPEKYLGSGVELLEDISLYGKENFKCSLIEEYNSKKDLDEGEKYWINYYKANENENFYNKVPGGLGGFLGIGPTASDYTLEVREKMSKARKGKPRLDLKGKSSPIAGKHFKWTPEKREEVRQKHLGKKWSLESKENFSKIRKGIKYTKERNNQIKKKYELKRQNNKWSEEEINLLLINKDKNNNYIKSLFPNRTWYDINNKKKELGLNILRKKDKIKIKCIELNRIFNSYTEAKEWLGKGDIANCLRGRQSTAGGYHWEYIK